MKFDVSKIIKSLPLKYFLMALLPMAVLLYTPTSNFFVLRFGEKILLQTIPVDPRDVLRGDYVMLSYEIADIPEERIPEEVAERMDDDPRREVYVALRLDRDGIAQVVGVSSEPPEEEVYLRAVSSRSWGFDGDVDYNLGVYYVPEGTGRELEEAIRDGMVLADVRVLRGRGVIKNLEVLENKK